MRVEMMRGVFAGLCAMLIMTGIAQAAPTNVGCRYDYTASNTSSVLYYTPADRTCAIGVIFGNSSGGSTSRVYSCIIKAGASECVITVDPQAQGVPADYVPKSGFSQSLSSSREEKAGCVYDFSKTTTPDYPQFSIMRDRITNQILGLNVIHRFACTQKMVP